MQHQSKLKHTKRPKHPKHPNYSFLLFAISLMLLPLWSNAQCPAGETEVIIALTSEEFIEELGYNTEDANWDYQVNGEISGSGPFAITDTVITCIPDGELSIVACGDWMVWGFILHENDKIAQIIDDGSQNNCEGNQGCYLYYDQNNIQYVIYTLPSCAEPPAEPIISFTVGCETSVTNTVGCTNEEAPNYNPCATDDDGSCQIEAPNNVCENVLPLNIESDCGGTFILIDNSSNSLSDLIPSCVSDILEYAYYTGPSDIFYEITVPASGNFIVKTGYLLHGVAIYDACDGNELFCNYGDDIEVIGMPAGESVILQLWVYGQDPFNFCVEALGETVSNDECINATQLCGELLTESNENAFSNNSDPDFSCSYYGSGENSVWYSLTADDSGHPIQVIISVQDCLSNYSTTPYEAFDGLSVAVFSGSCGAQTEVDCSNRVDPIQGYSNNPDQLAHIVDIDEPIAGATYFVLVNSVDYVDYCNYEITTSTGIETCCGPDIILDSGCQIGADEFDIIISVLDLGNNPSGYTVNDGEFPDITETGLTDIGPFPIGITTITLTGKDEMDCILTYQVEQDCKIAQGNTCDNPQLLEVDGFTACNFTTVVKDDNDFSSLLPNCLEGYLMEDQTIVWDNFFTFVVPPSGNFKVEFFASTESHFAIYDACDNTALDCVPYASQATFTSYEPGDTLLVQVLLSDILPFSICIEQFPEIPENDHCEDAIPICGATVFGTTQAASVSQSDTLQSCGYFAEQNIWYSFNTNNSGEPISIFLSSACEYNGMTASILAGNCTGGFEEVNCVDIFSTIDLSAELELILANPEPLTTYYLLISSSTQIGCPVVINTSINGIDLCCDMDFTITEQCDPDDPDFFYIDFQVSDFGENPNGLLINNGIVGTVTEIGSNIVGPFQFGYQSLTISGVDDPNCVINTKLVFDCAPPPLNDLCENAIEISCNGIFAGTNRGSTLSETDEICAQRDVDNTVWYSFTPTQEDSLSSFVDIYVRIEFEGIAGSEELSAGILSGSCGGPFQVEACTNFYNGGNLTFNEAIAGETYYILIGDIYEFTGDFTIQINRGVDDCPAPDITLTPTCPNGIEDVFYIEVEVNDLGDNPNGFVVNDGEFPNITTTGITTIGPLQQPFTSLIIEGVDNPLIRLDEGFVHYCDCEVFDGNPLSYTSPQGQYLQLPFFPFPTLSPLDCERTWVTDLNNIEGSLIGVGDSVYVAPDTTTLYYGIFECADDLNCTVEFTYIVDGALECNRNLNNSVPYTPGCSPEDITVLLIDFFGEVIDSTTVNPNDWSYSFTGEDYPCQTHIRFDGFDDCIALNDTLITTCDALSVIVSNNAGICPGQSYTASLEIQPLDSVSNCGFLYWVTDINNPDSTIVSTEASATFAPIETTRYYGIAACDNGEQCVGELTIYVYNEETCGDGPIIIDPPPPPPPGGSPTDTIPPPPPPSGGDPGVPGNPGPSENDDDNFDFTRCENPVGSINTLDKYVCFGEVPNVTLTDVDIPTGNSLYYAYHNTAELSNSSFIYAITFDDLRTSENVLPCATTVYLSAFTAPTVSNLNDIDLSNSCLLSNTLEIIYLCPVQIQVQEICNGNGTYSLVVTVIGGLPQVLGNLPFSIYGTVYKGNILHNQTFTIADLPDGSSYQIEAVDSEMCHDWVTDNVQCDKLPVELLSFEGEAQENGNALKWSTATEINNDYFTIESSKDGTNFKMLGTVKGSGNSSSVSMYEFLDRAATAGITYYRLSQTDFDGTTTIEALTEVTRGESNLNVVLLNTYPVPFNQTLNLQLYSDIGNSINVSLTDVLGKTLVKKHFNLSEGLNDMALSTASFPKGLYLIAIESNDNIIYQKVVKD